MLTAQGAQYLRRTRDYILTHPEEFSMAAWDCGTYACIGGHVGRIAGCDIGCRQICDVIEALGFDIQSVYVLASHYVPEHPLYKLFFRWKAFETYDAWKAAERINAFLWHYGYPPDAADEPHVRTPETCGTLEHR